MSPSEYSVASMRRKLNLAGVMIRFDFSGVINRADISQMRVCLVKTNRDKSFHDKTWLVCACWPSFKSQTKTFLLSFTIQTDF